MSLHFQPLTISRIEPDADAVLLSFDVPAAERARWAFNAGQYLTLRADVNGQDIRRSYSICSGEADGSLRVGIRRVPGGVFSNWAADVLQPGQALAVLPPQGRFTVPPGDGAPRHLLCIAAGSGITPMLSILRTVLAREPQTRCTLIYGNRRVASTMFRDALDDVKNRYLARFVVHHVFSREAQDAPLFHGRLDAARLGDFLQSLVPAASVSEAFVCGPAGMIDDAVAALGAAGIAPERTHVERFGDALPLAHHREARDADDARLTLVIDGLSREVDFRSGDPSVLDAATRAGLELPYSCKAGVCSTCKGRVLEGTVRMDRNFALTEAEVAQGFVLCCQAHPTSDRVVITLDQR